MSRFTTGDLRKCRSVPHPPKTHGLPTSHPHAPGQPDCPLARPAPCRPPRLNLAPPPPARRQLRTPARGILGSKMGPPLAQNQRHLFIVPRRTRALLARDRHARPAQANLMIMLVLEKQLPVIVDSDKQLEAANRRRTCKCDGGFVECGIGVGTGPRKLRCGARKGPRRQVVVVPSSRASTTSGCG